MGWNSKTLRYEDPKPSVPDEKIAVIGLGYVGLPVAIAMARKFDTKGYDINASRIAALKKGIDSTSEVLTFDLLRTKATFHKSLGPRALKGRTFIIVAVPTPIDPDNRPDLTPLIEVSKAIGPSLSKGALVVYESTVYPGVTEDICGPILEQTSGLRCGKDFFLGYSPERINPGDKDRPFESITKIVSGQNEDILNRVAAVYSAVVTAGVYRAESIRVAEAAKVIENTQRDLNIALMNEFAQIFDRMGIRTADVLVAAKTKWNFLPFTPGLVGGHCIGVDPYYLASKAESLGYRPEVILAGRRINNSMGSFIANKTVKLLSKQGITNPKVGIIGLTFKENVQDIRNSKVPDIVTELAEYGIQAIVHDRWADPKDAQMEYGIKLSPWSDLNELDALILAVAHTNYLDASTLELVKPQGFLIDVKSAMDPDVVRGFGIQYWSL